MEAEVAAPKKRGRPPKAPGAPKAPYTRRKVEPAPEEPAPEEEEEAAPPPPPKSAARKVKAAPKPRAPKQAAAPPPSSSESEPEDMNTAVLRYLVQRKNAERMKRETLWRSFLP